MSFISLFLIVLLQSFVYVYGGIRQINGTVDIQFSDYGYLRNLGDIRPNSIGCFGHLSRTETPKYTVIFMHGFVVNIDILYSLTSKFFVRMVRHLDHYDQSYSTNVQLIAPNWYKDFLPFTNELPEGTVAAFKSGRPSAEQYILQTASIIAFINGLVRKGIIHSLEYTGIHGNCLGGIIGIAASLGMKSNVGAVAICNSALLHPDLIRRKILRKSSLKASFLLIQGSDDQIIHPKFALTTESILNTWGVSSVILHKTKGGHFPVMAQHLYTGFRFIASVLLRRPEIFRLEDSYDIELIKNTKKRVENIAEITPIVPMCSTQTDRPLNCEDSKTD
ncbi:Alpha/Beta hydrolase fold containing protein [Cryptosporidium felis]|nr:Alpha/Beta hydrolase fold containing protein [Cryptosporidium felis]